MKENIIKNKIKLLKSQSGTHSPSIATILREIPEIEIKVDGCFLSNPYATELFFKYMKEELIDTGDIIRHLEFYPPQNYDVAKVLSSTINITPDKLFVGNGAIEVIQAMVHRFVKNKMVVIIPTFSSYYEFKKNDTQIVYYQLQKSNDYMLDPQDYVSFVTKEKPDTVVIINPNNPNGGYISKKDLIYIIESLNFVENIIIDESFVHFAFEDDSYEPVDLGTLVNKYSNLMIVKSMSKDFGIAGIRAGYGIMQPDKVQSLLKNGYLWNISGLAYYFFQTYSRPEFNEAYEKVRKRYIGETQTFLKELNEINGIKVYPSKANFALVELINGSYSFDFSMNMLANYGVYTRDCSDKIGLDGSFIRIASRNVEENRIIIESIKNTVEQQD